MTTILITGFGPFPGAPFNPTVALVRALTRERRPALADVRLVPHIFQTSYAAVDRELPALIRRHRPDAILMFGLAARTPHLRIETFGRNAISSLPDGDRHIPMRSVIAAGSPTRLALPTPAVRLLAAARAARTRAARSRDAGRYVCNYLCWRAGETAREPQGPRLVAFIHVPLVRRAALPASRVKKRRITAPDLLRSGRGLVRALAAAWALTSEHKVVPVNNLR